MEALTLGLVDPGGARPDLKLHLNLRGCLVLDDPVGRRIGFVLEAGKFPLNEHGHAMDCLLGQVRSYRAVGFLGAMPTFR